LARWKVCAVVVQMSAAVDGFRLGYERAGDGAAVVLLHGWPGDRSDYRLLGPMLVGYDIGSRIAQAIAKSRPELVRGLVIAPPLPGIGTRVFSERAQAEFWYQPFHKLPVVEELIDGQPDAVRAYLRHFWTHWSGPDFEPELDHLVEVYSAPGAFTASINWYRAGAGAVATSAAEVAPAAAERIGVRTSVVWPEFDPLFPRDWSDRLDQFFGDVTLRFVDGVGHFAPLEYPQVLAEEVLRLG
jgi:pimeloyl-ACP methyl ester carboxylesterase